MEQYIIVYSRYVIAVLMAVYTVLALVRAFRKGLDERRLDNGASALIFLIQFVAFLTICVETGDVDYLFFYAFSQLVLFAFMMLFLMIYPKMYRPLVNHMCILLGTGFFVLARLDFEKAAKQLAVRNELGLALFTKGPEPYQADRTYRYRHDKSDLTAALAAMQDRTERRLPPPASNFAGIVGTEPYPVTQKAKQVISRLLAYGVMRFLSLFKGSRSRSEIVATFLAVLELCRLRSVSVGEDENGEPSVTYLKTPDADVQTDIS